MELVKVPAVFKAILFGPPPQERSALHPDTAVFSPCPGKDRKEIMGVTWIYAVLLYQRSRSLTGIHNRDSKRACLHSAGHGFLLAAFPEHNAVNGVPIRQRRRLSCRFYLSLFIIYLN